MKRNCAEIITYPSEGAVDKAVQILQGGGLVVFPTETVYGLGGLMSCPQAVNRIYEVKGRQNDKPLSILVADKQQMWQAADAETCRRLFLKEVADIDVKTAADRLADRFWPGPLTLVLPKNPEVPQEVTAGRDTVGIRIPDHAFALALLCRLKEPVVTTSANLSGQAAAVSFSAAAAALETKVDLIVDGGECSVKMASTVAGFDSSQIFIFREGILSKQQLLEAAGRESGRAMKPGACNGTI